MTEKLSWSNFESSPNLNPFLSPISSKSAMACVASVSVSSPAVALGLLRATVASLEAWLLVYRTEAKDPRNWRVVIWLEYRHIVLPEDRMRYGKVVYLFEGLIYCTPLSRRANVRTSKYLQFLPLDESQFFLSSI